MTEKEGVIKFNLHHYANEQLTFPGLESLNSWRDILHQLELIGQLPERYEGLGFGNVSQRAARAGLPDAFVISGTQTGGLARMTRQHYAWVSEADVLANTLVSEGPIKPSSEALTHAAVYQSNPDINFVLHAHSPEIWKNADRLELPQTAIDAAYGTIAMAESTKLLMRQPETLAKKIFSMPGHEDGIVSFATALEDAAFVLIKTLAIARQLEQAQPKSS